MSTSYRLQKQVSFRDLIARVERHGIREWTTPETNGRKHCLTDGANYLWLYVADDDTRVASITRYAGNAPGKILDAIAEEFDTDIYSEYEPQFWGFDTQDQWDAFQQEAEDMYRSEFYADVCAYIRGVTREDDLPF